MSFYNDDWDDVFEIIFLSFKKELMNEILIQPVRIRHDYWPLYLRYYTVIFLKMIVGDVFDPLNCVNEAEYEYVEDCRIWRIIFENQILIHLQAIQSREK